MAGLVPAISLRRAPCPTKRGHRDEPGGDRKSKQPQLPQLPPHLLRHAGSARGGAGEIARRLLVLEIAPALERGARPRLDQLHLAIQHDLAAADAVLAGDRADIENFLAAGDLALDYPIERAAIGEFLGTLGQHAGRMDALRLLPALLSLLQLELDPFLE